MSKIEELLAVLDLPEDKQHIYIFDNYSRFRTAEKKYAFADLAFRLRDEVLSGKFGTIKWVAGMFDVYMKMTGSKLFNWKWGYVKAQPIHWIIAALIAKEKP